MTRVISGLLCLIVELVLELVHQLERGDRSMSLRNLSALTEK